MRSNSAQPDRRLGFRTRPRSRYSRSLVGQWKRQPAVEAVGIGALRPIEDRRRYLRPDHRKGSRQHVPRRTWRVFHAPPGRSLHGRNAWFGSNCTFREYVRIQTKCRSFQCLAAMNTSRSIGGVSMRRQILRLLSERPPAYCINAIRSDGFQPSPRQQSSSAKRLVYASKASRTRSNIIARP